MGKLNILLLTLNINVDYTPLALGYLKAFLEEDNYISNHCNIMLRMLPNNASEESILWYINKHNPDILGFSCFLWNIEKILNVARIAKVLNPQLKIILGGSEVSPRAKDILRENPAVDIVVTGEGEQTFKEVIQHYLKKEQPGEKIMGITYRERGRIISNPQRPPLEKLDDIPSPYLKGAIKLYPNTFAVLETQRGCPFKCHFCYYHKSFKGIRYFSLDRVKKDLEFLLNSPVKRIFLMDPTFNLSKERMREICKFIESKNKRKVEFHAEIRADLVDEETADLFQRANISSLEIGLQSSDEQVLKNINRHCNLEKLQQGVKLLNQKGIKTELQLIAGLPGDTWEKMLDSVRFSLKMNPWILSIFNLLVLPGTYLQENAEQLGIVFNRKPPYEVLYNSTFSFEHIRCSRMLSNSLLIFRRVFPETFSLLSQKLGKDVIELFFYWKNWLEDDEEILLEDSIEICKYCFQFLPKFIKEICIQDKIEYEEIVNIFHQEKEAILRVPLTFGKVNNGH